MSNHVSPIISGPVLKRAERVQDRNFAARQKREFADRQSYELETRADRQILNRLVESFESEMPVMDVSAISFFVRNRTVTINGFIRDRADRTLLVSVVGKTRGVDRVIDRLQSAPERFRSRLLRRSA